MAMLPDMEGVEEDEKEIRVVLFASYLFKGGQRRDQVGKAMSAMAAVFELAGKSSKPFRSAIAARARRAAIGSNEELKAKNRAKKDKPTLPLAVDMVMGARSMLWVNSVFIPVVNLTKKL